MRVESATEAIVASGLLGRGGRRTALLRYLVAQELDGRGDAIKAFTIAVDVFGRDAGFDPNTDSIVRSEIGRLREALRLYHAERAGPGDVRIEIPKGTYRPVFSGLAPAPEVAPGPEASPVAPDPGGRARSWLGLALAPSVLLVALVFGLQLFRDAADAPSLPAATAPDDPPFAFVRVAVVPFEPVSQDGITRRVASGLGAELAMDLSAYPWLAVVAPVDTVGEAARIGADYALFGEVGWDAEGLDSAIRLVALPDQTLVWSQTGRVEAHVAAIETEIAALSGSIATTLGGLHGIAPALATARNARLSEEGLAAYLCYLGLFHYLDHPSDARHLELRACLTEAVAQHPRFGDGWAALAFLHMDEARFGRNPRAGADPWRDAAEAVARARLFEPLRMLVLNAALVESIEAPDRDPGTFARVSERLLTLFPRHAATLYNVGSRQAEFAGDWEAGLARVEAAIALHPDPPSAFFVTRAYRAALGSDDAAALESVAPLTIETSRSQLMLRYLAAARNGLREAAEQARTGLAAEGLATTDAIIAHVRGRGYAEALEAALVAQLDAARDITDRP